MNLALPKVVRKAWDLERLSLVKSSPILASEDPRGRSVRPLQAWWAMDREEHALCMGKDWSPPPADSSQTEGARGYTLSL